MPGRPPGPAPSHRLAAFSLALLGAVLLGLGVLARTAFRLHPTLGALDGALVAAGCAVGLLAILPARGVLPRLFLGLAVSLGTLLASLALLEVLFRAVGFDFRQQERAWRRLPPSAREPRTPTGSVFFRHDGPETWTGPVLRRGIELLGWPVPDVYRDETPITVRYDAQGFRNEEPLEPWDIAVAGDSFTEAGCLPHDQLFTTLLARWTGRRVRNLGVSSTGPFTHLSYLEDYGLSPKLEHAIIVFFEGNDLRDLTEEHRALRRFESTGERPDRRIVPQSSLLTALGDLWVHPVRREPLRLDLIPTFHFHSATGAIPVHVTQVPPDPSALGPGTDAILTRFARGYRSLAARHGFVPWLAYMPCNGRVLHERLRALEPHREGGGLWVPNALPQCIRDLCRHHGIGFIDLSPVLTGAAIERGELVFNPLMDIHLNARGARLVAEELARWFARPTPLPGVSHPDPHPDPDP